MFRQVFARPGRAWASRQINSAIKSGERVTLYDVKVKPNTNVLRYSAHPSPRPLLTLPPPILTKVAKSKVALYTVAGVGCYLVWNQVVGMAMRNLDPRPIPKELLREANEQSLFFPFPFTDKLVRPLPYAGAEEEWQGFINFNKDSDLKERVKNDLNMLVKRTAERSPQIKRWGKNGETFTLGPTWLIMSFPERPPPEWVRTGYVAISCYAVSHTSFYLMSCWLTSVQPRSGSRHPDQGKENRCTHEGPN